VIIDELRVYAVAGSNPDRAALTAKKLPGVDSIRYVFDDLYAYCVLKMK
jgi:hypothetical protein